MGVQIHRARALPGTELIGVGEGVLQELHHRDDTGGLVLGLLDGCALLTQVRQQQGHSAAALGQLERGVDAPSDGLQVVLHPEEEAGDQFAALGLARVEEGRCGRLEAAGHHLVDQPGRQRLVAGAQEQGGGDDPVLVPLQVAGAVEGLQRVRRVVLERTEERTEPVLVGVRLPEQPLDELPPVAPDRRLLVVVVLDQVIDLLLQ